MKLAAIAPICFFTTLSIASAEFSPPPEEKRLWAFELGVAFITSNNNSELFLGNIDIDSGSAGGEIYSLTASRYLGELEWHIGNSVFRPQMELPLRLEIVDENGRSPFLDYNASFMLRWVDFPWNNYVKTTLGMGVGLSYSNKVLLMDQKRHQDEHRSKLKFDWPIQVTFAAPSSPEHQLMLFIAHQSGGHIFDQGGVNSLGFGYRYGF